MYLSDCSEAERRDLAVLEARVGLMDLRQRLGLEGEHEAHIFRQGTHFFHLENWLPMHRVIRAALTLTGLHGRGKRNVLNIQCRNNEICLESLPPGFDGYTVLHLSDLHLDMSPAHVERLIESVQRLPSDACVLTGDFRFRTFGSYAVALEALERMRPYLGERVYAVLGNHDTIRMVPSIEALGISVLMNESARIVREDEALTLVGIDDAHYYRTHNFHKALAGVAPDACTILLSHTPEPYRHAAHSGISLMLCGHTHGGQICLPGGIPIITDCDTPRAMARGAWRHNDMVGYTSVGCGSSIVDVRLNCLPEITLHRLQCGSSSVADMQRK